MSLQEDIDPLDIAERSSDNGDEHSHRTHHWASTASLVVGAMAGAGVVRSNFTQRLYLLIRKLSLVSQKLYNSLDGWVFLYCSLLRYSTSLLAFSWVMS